MHYYQFNIGDYAKATRHLTNDEDLAYRRLIELYYDTEKPLIKDIKKLSRLINMRENEQDIEVVLGDFFTESENGYSQNRIEREIVNYHSKADKARANGKLGGRPKKANANQQETESKAEITQPVNLANQEETGLKANQEPLTNNQEPLTNKKIKVPYQLIVDAYNEITGLPRVVTYTAKRKAAVKKLFSFHDDHKDIEWWKYYFTKISTIAFLHGENDRGWVANFDFVLDLNKFVKILEGDYK